MTRLLTLFAITVVLALTAVVAFAEDATVTITGGPLTSTAANVTLTGVTLDGTDKTTSSAYTANSWQIVDARGTGAGYCVTIDATDFGINEVQEVHNDATSGTFTLTFSAETTGDIAYDAAAATVETALEALSTITDVTVTGAGTSGDPWVVTFVDPGKQDVSLMTADDTNLVGGTSTISTATAGRATTIDISVADQDFKITIDDVNTVVNAGDETNKPASQVASLTNIPTTGVSSQNILSAATDVGMGDYTYKPAFDLEVRAETYAGSHTSTMTITASSGACA